MFWGVYKYVRGNVEFYTTDKFGMALMRKELFPSGPIIPLVYQFNLLTDKQRMQAFRKSILSVVKNGDSVVDLGCGNGIMLILASQKARIVDSVEIDVNVFNFADF